MQFDIEVIHHQYSSRSSNSSSFHQHLLLQLDATISFSNRRRRSPARSWKRPRPWPRAARPQPSSWISVARGGGGGGGRLQRRAEINGQAAAALQRIKFRDPGRLGFFLYLKRACAHVPFLLSKKQLLHHWTAMYINCLHK